MAYIRTQDTGKTHANGKPVMRYEVCWRETVRNEFGLPVPSVTPTDCEALLVTLRHLSPSTIGHVWDVSRRLRYAVAHGAIAFNPADRLRSC